MPTDNSRFLAPAPIIIPKGASRTERIELRYGAFGPPKGTTDAARADIVAGKRKGMSDFLKTMPRR